MILASAHTHGKPIVVRIKELFSEAGESGWTAFGNIGTLPFLVFFRLQQLS
jgi:hypothetical protein